MNWRFSQRISELQQPLSIYCIHNVTRLSGHYRLACTKECNIHVSTASSACSILKSTATMQSFDCHKLC